MPNDLLERLIWSSSVEENYVQKLCEMNLVRYFGTEWTVLNQ